VVEKSINHQTYQGVMIMSPILHSLDDSRLENFFDQHDDLYEENWLLRSEVRDLRQQIESFQKAIETIRCIYQK